MKVISKVKYIEGLTYGKIYDVVEIDKNGYKIVDDNGGLHYYYSERFQRYDDFIDNQINKLL